ncbi:MAG: MBL fold metallo-hydrolase [Candidatus Krumholzibacteriia bacterium]
MRSDAAGPATSPSPVRSRRATALVSAALAVALLSAPAPAAAVAAAAAADADPARAQPPPARTDTIATAAGPLTVTLLGHGTLMFTFAGRVVHVDPWSRVADYDALPRADLILVTHEHGDHLDPDAIAAVRDDSTGILANAAAAEQIVGARALANGDRATAGGIAVEAVPAYNLVHMRSGTTPYHPRGQGNGYVITFGDQRVYVAGDTENTPEMKALADIDVAFLPMNLPYTMTPEMVADAARAFRPTILYPYHYGDTDPQELVRLLEGSGIEVRVRAMR